MAKYNIQVEHFTNLGTFATKSLHKWLNTHFQKFCQVSKYVRSAKLYRYQGRIQDLIGGGPDRDRPKFMTVHSSIVRAKQALFSVGSGAHLRAPEALGYFITKYAFSPFWGTFLYYF